MTDTGNDRNSDITTADRILNRLPSNPVNVQFSVVRQVVVDYQGNLWHVETSCPHVGRN